MRSSISTNRASSLDSVYSYGLYTAMRKHCTVVLSGNGADELFTGYNGDESRLRFDRARRWLRHVPDRIYRPISARRRAEWDHIRLGSVNVPGLGARQIRSAMPKIYS